jgi:uncharacterized protein with von Willebrand factor type A (vWA) domain
MQIERDASGQSRIAPPKTVDEAKAQEIEQRMQQLAEALEDRLRESAEASPAVSSDRSDQDLADSVNRALREAEFDSMGFEPHERAAFERFKALEQSTAKEVREMIKQLLPILPKKFHSKPEQWFRSGKSLDIRRLMRREPVGQIDFYERRSLVPGVDPKLFVQLVIDRSGSMFPQKMPEAIRTAIFWGMICQQLGIPFAVKFFDDTYCRVKDYHEPYDGVRNRVKPNMVLLAEATGGSTNMGAPLSVAFEEMKAAKKRYPSAMGAVFVISDAGANAGLTGEPLRALVRRMQQEFLVGAFILTDNERDLKHNRYYFGDTNVVAPDHFADLPRESFRILKETIVQFAKKCS